MTIPASTNSPLPGDGLHSESHSHLTPEEIAKAVARHQREHPNQAAKRSSTPQKTTPHR